MQQSNSLILLPGPEQFGAGKADAFVATSNTNPSTLTRPTFTYKLLLLLLAGWLLLAINSQQTFAQPIETNPMQDLNFGDFYPGATGGTVIVHHSGSRTSSGTVVLMGGAVSAARIQVDLNPRKTVNITCSPSATLTRPGGGNMQLTIAPGNVSPTQITSTPSLRTFQIYIGGTLTVGNIQANPAGSYAGTFNVYFNYD